MRFWATVPYAIGPLSCLPWLSVRSVSLLRWCIVAKRLDGSTTLCQIVLDGDPALPPKRGTVPNFRPMSVVAKRGWMDQDATWYGGRLDPGDIVLDGDIATVKKGEGHSRTPFLGPRIVAKRLDGSTYAPWYGGMPRPRPHCVR